jgi:cryptochrome
VACFLTRGQCYISWERGAEVFQEWLIDHDPACNIGNWYVRVIHSIDVRQWLSCTCFFSQYYRVYSPTAFPKKYDPTGALVRHYCPELSQFPDRYIYEPWLASVAEQRKAGCIIGVDYPERMLDDKERRDVCLRRMKAAYDVGFMGDAKEVLDGSAEGILREKYASTEISPKKRKRDVVEKGQKGIEAFINGSQEGI